ELVGLSERLSAPLALSDPNCGPLLDQLLSIEPVRVAQPSQLYTTHLVTLIWRLGPELIRIGLFDLDRWYHAQLPTCIRSDNSFFAVFDASVPRENIKTLNGHLISSSLTSFWSRIASRDRQFAALYEVSDPENVHARTTHHSLYGASVSNPVPEVCLRPSALSFEFFLGWAPTDEHRSDPGGIVLLRFASRQEACLLSLSNYYTLADDKNNNNINKSSIAPSRRFDITDWLSEAWVTGLLESPGLDPLDEEDLERLLQFAQDTANPRSKQSVDEQEAECVGFRLAFGEDLDATVVHELDDLLSNSVKSELSDLTRPSKRMKTVPSHSDATTDKLKPHLSRVVLNPAWVLMANCLLEHSHLPALKSLNQIAHGAGASSPSNPEFLCIWLWLRFRRLKCRFDRLTGPLFDTAAVQSASSFSVSTHLDAQELGALLYQVQQLTVLGRHWFEREHPSAGSHNIRPSCCGAIETFASYARLVAFLCRLGLLPQSHETQSDVDLGEWLTSTSNINSLLLPYHAGLFDQVIWQMRFRGDSTLDNDEQHFDEEGRCKLVLANALLHACLSDPSNSDRHDGTDSWSIWCEQEEAATGHRKSPSYPPRRLQSLCALWQLPSSPDSYRARLGLLGFLLCDATAVAAFARKNASSAVHDLQTANPHMLAVKLCRHVLLLLTKEFPTIRPLLPTIFLLWLLDRGFFKESLMPQLRTYVTSATVGYHSHLPGRLVTLFPNQHELVGNYLKSCNQADVWDHLKRCLQLDSPTNTGRSTCSSALRKDLTDDFRATGAPFLALSKLRRSMLRLETFRTDDDVDSDLFDKAHSMARGAFIRLAEACRRAGRLGDLVNLDLSPSEARILFDHYKKTGQHVVVFHCLLARKQYKSALQLYAEYRQLKRTNSESHSNELDVLYKLLIESLPEHHEDPVEFVDGVCERLPEALTCTFPDEETELKAPFIGIAYRRDSAVPCPLTVSKREQTYKPTRKRDFSALSHHNDAVQWDTFDATPITFGQHGIHQQKGSQLLDNSNKISSEFWETFQELESLHRSCNLTSDYATLNSFLNDSMAIGSRPSGWMPEKTSKDNKTDRLFKCIYTPPPNRLKNRREPVDDHLSKSSTSRRRLSTRGSFRAAVATSREIRTPVSILKSPGSKSSIITNRPDSVAIPVWSPSKTVDTSVDSHALNATLDDDADVTLNLSTIRPSSTSLSATPIVHPVSKESRSTTTTTTIFTFSAPQHLSTASPNPPSFSQLRSESEFQFAMPVAPLVSIDRCASDDVSSQQNLDSPSVLPAKLESASCDTDDDMELTATWSAAEKTIVRESSPVCSECVSTSESSPKPSSILPSEGYPSKTSPRSSGSDVSGVRGAETLKDEPGQSGNDSMDLDDTGSVISSTDGSSFSSETPRRSGRRVRAPKRYDPSKF
ncbi:hypothetical protein EG68_07355, partial [Paragonimus skrjabini miyazakii]